MSDLVLPPPPPLDEPAQDAPAEAPAPIAERIQVRAPNGVVGTVDSSEYDAALRSGYMPLDAREAEVERLRPELGGALGQAASAGLGLARTASFGLSDPLYIEGARALGGDAAATDVRESLNLAREVNPTASSAGEVAGFFAPTGLAGALGKGIGLAGGAAKAGARVVAPGLVRAGEGLAQSAIGRVVARGLASGAAGAAEGAVYGVGSEISEDSLGDHEITAEKLFAAAEKGGLFGAVAGGTLGAGGQTLEEGARAARGGIAAVKTGLAAGINLAERGSDAIVDAASRLPGAKYVSSLVQGDVAAFTRDARGFLDTSAGQLIARTEEPAMKKALDRIYREGKLNAQAQEELLDTATRSVVKDAKPVLDAERTVYEVSLEQKGEQMARLVNPETRLAQKEASLNVWQEARDLIDFWKDTAAKGGLEGGFKKFGKVLKDFESEIGDAVSKGAAIANPEKAYMLLDQLKRDAGHFAQFGKDPWARSEAAAGKALPSFEGFYNKVRATLEDESIWGNAAAAQREINGGHTLALQTRDKFGNWFVEKYGGKAGEPLYELDPSRVKGFLSSIDGAESDLKARAFTDFGAGMRAKMDAIEKHFVLSPPQKASFDAARAGLDKMDASFAAARGEAEHVATVRRMRAGEGERTMLDHAAPVIGGMVAGPVGAAGGLAANLAADAIARPLTTAERLRGMKVALDKFDKIHQEAVAAIAGNGPAVGAAAQPFTSATKKYYADIAREVTRLSASGDELLARVGKTFGSVNAAAPKVATSIGSLSTKAVQFLASKAPKETVGPASLTPHLDKPTAFSDTEISHFARYLHAVKDPRTVVTDMKRGVLTTEGIEAMKAVYPRIYEETRTMMMAQLSARATRLPYLDEVRIGTLLDIPANYTMTPEFLGAVQASKESPVPQQDGGPAQGGKPARKSNTSTAEGFATQSQRIESS